MNLSKEFDESMTYIWDEKNQRTHAISPRQDALHLSRVLRTIWKFRSQRGGVHISPTYKPNHMDFKIIIEMVRWMVLRRHA